ncbi:MAG: T9SS type A sorting domain-containing protein [Weeksellaceae bacterium]
MKNNLFSFGWLLYAMSIFLVGGLSVKAQSLLYDNGSVFNIAGPPQVSMLQDASLGMDSYGFNIAKVNSYSIADDFTLTNESTIDYINAFVYQTGANAATITGIYIKIWNGNPSSGGTVVWGDFTTNRLESAVLSGGFRQLESAPGDTSRRIQTVRGNTPGLSLMPGTYWIEYTLEGTVASGPWAPPITITGQSTTGNALQFTGTYDPLVDSGTNTPQGLPFQIYGDEVAGGPFPAPYCEVSGLSSVEPITRVIVADIDNASPNQSSAPRHEDFTSVIGHMTQGSSYELKVEGNTSGNFTTSVHVYVDWNNDGDFTDAGEYFFGGTLVNSTGSDGKQAIGTIVVPSDATVGNKRMRIIKRFQNVVPNPNDGCTGGSTFGQAEDYTITVTEGGGQPGGGCTTPILEVNQDIDNTCMANFSQGGLAQSYTAQESEAAGAGIKFRDSSTGLDVTLSLWDGLPNAGGVMLATKTTQTDGTEWADVYWDSVVSVTVGDTYFIVIDGDMSLPCVAGALNNPYSGGMAHANDYGPFPDYDYTFRTYSCDDGGEPEPGDDCSLATTGTFEDGKSFTKELGRIVANDIVVTAGQNMTLEKININAFVGGAGSGVTTNNVDVIIYKDNGGMPGDVLDTQSGIVPTSQTSIGTAFGFEAWDVEIDINDFALNGDENNPIKYWIGVSLSASDGSNVFWEYASTGVVGSGLAYDDGTGFIVENANEGVYTFHANCSVIGGEPEPEDCTFEHATSGDGNGGSGSSVDSEYKSAVDLVIPAGEVFTLHTIKVPFLTFAPEDAPVTAHVVYYEDDNGFPGIEMGDETVVPTILSSGVWVNPVAYVFETELAMTPYTFNGDSGSETRYWVEISMGTATNQQTVFWLYTAGEGLEGQPMAQFNLTDGWTTPDNTQEGVYSFSGQCDTLGVSDMTSFDFAYYPNPVKDVLNIKTEKAVKSVEAFNLTGQKVISNAKVLNGQINVNALTTGTYVFRVTLEDGQVETFKIIKK